MKYIYLDNASTTFPKAPTVASAMSDYITNRGININRGSYALAYDVEDIIYTTRQRLNCDDEFKHGYQGAIQSRRPCTD